MRMLGHETQVPIGISAMTAQDGERNELASV
jgi:isopentenyl diphosphate isomerase/L-lactate dehydrogenase-like FMN-dependent dehydrogenase